MPSSDVACKARVVEITLHVKNQHEAYPTRTFTLKKPAWTICVGRSSKDTDKMMRAGGNNAWFNMRVMSREHALLRADPNSQKVFLEDVGSMHGTYCNGGMIIKNAPTEVKSQDVLRFGAEVTRGSETFLPLEIQIDYRWAKDSPPSNQFSVPEEDDDELEIIPDSVIAAMEEAQKLAEHFVPESDTSSAEDESLAQPSPLSSTGKLISNRSDDGTDGKVVVDLSSPPPVEPSSSLANTESYTKAVNLTHTSSSTTQETNQRTTDGNHSVRPFPSSKIDQINGSLEHPITLEDENLAHGIDFVESLSTGAGTPAEKGPVHHSVRRSPCLGEESVEYPFDETDSESELDEEACVSESDIDDLDDMRPMSESGDDGDDNSLGGNDGFSSDEESELPDSLRSNASNTDPREERTYQENLHTTVVLPFVRALNDYPHEINRTSRTNRDFVAPSALEPLYPYSATARPSTSYDYSVTGVNPNQISNRPPSPSDAAMVKPTPDFSFNDMEPNYSWNLATQHWSTAATVQKSNLPPVRPVCESHIDAPATYTKAHTRYLEGPFSNHTLSTYMSDPTSNFQSSETAHWQPQAYSDMCRDPPPSCVEGHGASGLGFAHSNAGATSSPATSGPSESFRTAYSKVSIDDIVEKAGERSETTKLKRKYVDICSNEESEVSFSGAESIRRHEESYPDAQPRSMLHEGLSSTSQFSTLSQGNYVPVINPTITDSTVVEEPPKKKVKIFSEPRGRSFTELAATALAGVVLGGVGTVAALVALPPGFFA